MDNRDLTGALPELTRREALAGLGWTLATATGLVASGQSAMAQHATPAALPTVPPDFRVVLHASQEQHWVYVLSNLKNLTQEWPKAHLRVVADGTSVLVLEGKNAVTNELTSLVALGVELQVCPNALHEHQIDPASIPSYAQIGLGGVVALVVAQREGFAYVKP